MGEPKRYAMIDADGLVYNVALWDGVSEWTHDAAQVVQSDTVNIGDIYTNGKFRTPISEERIRLLATVKGKV
jgi:hypothetical protein